MTLSLTSGRSTQHGIYLSGKYGPTDLGAYAYRRDGHIVCKSGSPDEIKALVHKQRQADCADAESGMGKVALMFLIPIVVIILAAIFAQNGFQVAGIAVFAVAAAFPCYTLTLVGENDLTSDELFQQLRRHHGAEHTLFAYYRKNRKAMPAELIAEDLQGYGYLDPECGTVWMGTIIIWAIVLGIAIALIPLWGFGSALKLVLAATVLLLINMYANPMNPLKLIQKPEVLPPTLAELEVAAAAFNALQAAYDRQGGGRVAALHH